MKNEVFHMGNYISMFSRRLLVHHKILYKQRKIKEMHFLFVVFFPHCGKIWTSIPFYLAFSLTREEKLVVSLTTSQLLKFPRRLIVTSRNTLWNIVVTYTYKGRLSTFNIYIFQVCKRYINNNLQILFLV